MGNTAFSELEESNQQAIEAWKAFARGAPKGDIRVNPGVTVVFCNVALPFLNMAFLSNPVRDLADLDTRIATTIDYASKAGFPWMFFLCNDWIPESIQSSQHDVFARHGLHPTMNFTGMVTDTLVPPSKAPLLEYRRVMDEATRCAISDVNCLAYQIPIEMGRESITQQMFDSSVFAYVGHLTGEAVAVAGTWIVDEIMYVGMVATMPDHRRKGYAEAVMRHSLEEARKATGIRRTVLHATDAGFPVYERMGYRTVARFTAYMSQH